MKRLLLIGAIGVAVVGFARLTGAQTQPPAVFQIVVEPSANGLTATCLKGCAWKTLSFGCEPKKGEPCKAEIDQLGVGGTK
jgi:hypothetical protein